MLFITIATQPICLHESVIMPDHFARPHHAADQSREGGSIHQGRFSYRVKKELGSNMEVWQRGLQTTAFGMRVTIGCMRFTYGRIRMRKHLCGEIAAVSVLLSQRPLRTRRRTSGAKAHNLRRARLKPRPSKPHRCQCRKGFQIANAQTQRHLQDTDPRLRPHRHWPVRRVRLLGHAGLQGASRPRATK